MMRSSVCVALVVAFAFSVQPAAAQSTEDQMMRLETAMADGQANASRPGDENLSCDQLQTEMVTSMQDPALQAHFAAQGAWAQGQMDQMNGARGRLAAQFGTSLFMGLASSFIPGLGYAQAIQQRATAASQQAQAEQNMATMMANAEAMSAFMPQLMRGQRIYELGQIKQCAFLEPPPDQ